MISFIIPVYNAQRTLSKCVESVIRLVGNHQVILVNDGSTDQSLQLCERYRMENRNVKVIDKPNGGASSARNAGLKVAEGEYVFFLDADDWIPAESADILNREYSADLVLFGYLRCRENGEPIRVDRFEENRLLSGAEEMKSFLPSHMQAFRSSCAKLFKKKLIGELRFDENMVFAEDNEFVLRFLSKVDSVYVSAEIAYNYVDSGDPFFIKYKQSIDRSIYCLKRLYDAYHKIGIHSPYFVRYAWCDTKKLCQEEIYRTPARWYGNEDVRAIYGNIKKDLGMKYRIMYRLSSCKFLMELKKRFFRYASK